MLDAKFINTASATDTQAGEVVFDTEYYNPAVGQNLQLRLIPKTSVSSGNLSVEIQTSGDGTTYTSLDTLSYSGDFDANINFCNYVLPLNTQRYIKVILTTTDLAGVGFNAVEVEIQLYKEA